MNNIKQKLKQLVEQPRGAGRAVDWAIQSLIVVSLIVFSISTLPDLTATAHAVLYSIEVVLVLIFTAEYALRVYVATHRRKFIFSFLALSIYWQSRRSIFIGRRFAAAARLANLKVIALQPIHPPFFTRLQTRARRHRFIFIRRRNVVVSIRRRHLSF